MNQNKIHFISGLPRSGSTMLSSILKQNPKFHAGMTSPVSTIFKAMEYATSQQQEMSLFINEKQRQAFLKGSFETYYKGVDKDIIFDTSRMWTARTSILFHLFPEAKMICCVRDLSWIMDSFEKLYRNNFQEPSGIYGYDTGGTVYSRCNKVSNSNGVVGFALDALREACASEHADKILLIEYEDICKEPSIEIEKIYEFLGQGRFVHDFKNVEHNEGEFDKKIGAEGLHKVKKEVKWSPRETILPNDLFNRYINDNFWRNDG